MANKLWKKKSSPLFIATMEFHTIYMHTFLWSCIVRLTKFLFVAISRTYSGAWDLDRCSHTHTHTRADCMLIQSQRTLFRWSLMKLWTRNWTMAGFILLLAKLFSIFPDLYKTLFDLASSDSRKSTQLIKVFLATSATGWLNCGCLSATRQSVKPTRPWKSLANCAKPFVNEFVRIIFTLITSMK